MAEIQRKNAKKKSAGRQAWDAVLTGISYMIPFIVGGGVLWGIAKAMGGYNIAADMKAVGGYTEYTLAMVIYAIGSAIFDVCVPVIGAYTAYALADKPGLAPGFAVGVISNTIKAGFLGAVVGGIIAGYIVNFLKDCSKKVPSSVQSVFPILIIPVVGTAVTSLLMWYVIGVPIGWVMTAITSLLTNLQEGDVLFIDEIHRLSRQVEEVLYPALEDYALDIMIGKGPSAQSIRINLPRFTLVGATTRAGQITGPLRDRFGVLLKLELYSPDELSRIIQRSAGILDQPITPEGAYELAKCSRGTPRVANRFLKRIRDFATVLGDGVIDRDVSLMGLKRMDVDALGLDELDRSLLRAIIEMYNGGPVGLETLAAALGEEAVTLEDLCEPYLMQMGFLTRTPRGRCATRLAYEHLGLKAPEMGSPEDNGQQSLF